MIYVMSDIHGNKRNFDSIMNQIQLQPKDTLYILGDVIDRYPYGIDLLCKIKTMPNAKLLLGNHEYMMLNALEKANTSIYAGNKLLYYKKLELWYENGGDATHREFKKLDKATRTDLLVYLKHLPISVDIEIDGKKYKLVHSTPPEMFMDNTDPWYNDERQFAVWNRLNAETPIPKGYTLIFGHTPTIYFQEDNILKIWYGDDRIGIDCGSGFLDLKKDYNPEVGRLACLRLNDMKEFYSNR